MLTQLKLIWFIKNIEQQHNFVKNSLIALFEFFYILISITICFFPLDPQVLPVCNRSVKSTGLRWPNQESNTKVRRNYQEVHL